MLRIITVQKEDHYRVELHGALRGPWVVVLEDHWRSIVERAPSAKINVVLADVEFIDEAGEQLLGRMADDGVPLVVSGCMNRYLIEKLQRI